MIFVVLEITLSPLQKGLDIDNGVWDICGFNGSFVIVDHYSSA